MTTYLTLGAMEERSKTYDQACERNQTGKPPGFQPEFTDKYTTEIPASEVIRNIKQDDSTKPDYDPKKSFPRTWRVQRREPTTDPSSVAGIYNKDLSLDVSALKTEIKTITQTLADVTKSLNELKAKLEPTPAEPVVWSWFPFASCFSVKSEVPVQ